MGGGGDEEERGEGDGGDDGTGEGLLVIDFGGMWLSVGNDIWWDFWYVIVLSLGGGGVLWVFGAMESSCLRNIYLYGD